MEPKTFTPKDLPLKAWWRPEDYKPGRPWIDCISGQKLTGNYESSKDYNPLEPHYRPAGRDSAHERGARNVNTLGLLLVGFGLGLTLAVVVWMLWELFR